MVGWLGALLLAAFVLYTDDYVVAGVLPEIAAGLGVTEAAAGQLVTVFSVTVAVAAPVAAVVLARVPRVRLFAGGVAVFVLANAGAALTPTFGVLMGLRVVAALAAAAVTPALFATAAEHAPDGRQGSYLGTVALGVTGSIALGVPLGTWVGGLWGWRATFGLLAVAGVVVVVALWATLPHDGGPRSVPPLREQLSVLASRPVSLGLLSNGVLILGSMMLLTYFGPYLADLTGSGPSERAVLFATAGVAGMIGIWLGGKAVDRWGPDRTLLAGITTFAVAMAVLTVLWLLRPVPVAVVAPLSFVWGGAAFWNAPAIQARLLRLAGPVGPQALALNTSATYLGVAAGGALGGTLLAVGGTGVLAPVSGVLGVAALGVLALAARPPAATRPGRSSPTR